MSHKELEKLYREFITKLYIEQKLPQGTFDEIIEFIDEYGKQKEIERKEKNRLAQKRYYEKNKEKVKKKNLEYYHLKKQRENNST